MKIVKENIEFERGLEPKDAMSLGDVEGRKFQKVLRQSTPIEIYENDLPGRKTIEDVSYMMKIVRENIEFERGLNPNKAMDIGKDSIFMKTKKYNELRNKGITIWNLENEKYIIENIYELEKGINKLIDIGVSLTDLEINANGYHYNIRITNAIQVIASNHVLVECLSKEDGEMIINILEKFAFPRGQYRLDVDEHKTIYGQDGKWADNTAWIDNLTENRKKYKKLYEKIS